MTGSGGFIGRHVCTDLVRRGFSVRALTRDSSRVIPGVEIWANRDLLDVESLRPSFRGADAVIHLAGRAHMMFDERADEAYRLTNVEGTRAVAKAAAAESVRHVIFSSSVKAVGEGGEVRLTCDTPEAPQDAYGRSKLEAERILAEVCDAAGIVSTVVRFPVVYGPGVKGNILRLFDAVWRGIPVPVGGIANARSMLGIDNILGFLAVILDRPPASGKPFLLSDGEAVSTERLVKLIGEKLGRTARVVGVPIGLLRLFAAAGDAIASLGMPIFTSGQLERLTGSLVVDSSAAWRAAGIAPPVSLDVGIGRTAAWYCENHKSRSRQ